MSSETELDLTVGQRAASGELLRRFTKYDGDAEVPTYEPSVHPPIVHIGVSNFHRSHFGDYLSDLLERGQGEDWSILAAGLLPLDEPVINALRAQGEAYSLLTFSADGDIACKVLHPHAEVRLFAQHPNALAEQIANPVVRIVSLTVTEAGYYLTGDLAGLDLANKWVAEDLQDPRNPKTHLGVIVEGLRRRKDAGLRGLTLLSCDNLQGNGDTLKKVLLSFAQSVDAELAAWIGENTSFPNSMVDRITPRTSEADSKLLLDRFGIADAAPVVSESYKRWVIEDDFFAGRPAWELVGAELVDDVRPYEEMKLRLLNSSHQTMAYVSSLLGHEFVDQALDDPRVLGLLEAVILGESVPTLTAFPREVYEEYFAQVVARFKNARLRDTIERLCWHDSTMLSTFLAPVVTERLAAGQQVTAALITIASWAVYVDGLRASGRDVPEPTKYAEVLLGAHPAALAEWWQLYEQLSAQGVESFLDSHLSKRPNQ